MARITNNPTQKPVPLPPPVIETPEDQSRKLDQLAEVDNKALFTCSTVFPFSIFPTTLIVDRNKVTVREYFFFGSRQLQTFLIQDVMNILVAESLLFASIQLVHSRFPDEKIDIHNLTKADARKFRLIVQGLMVADKQGLNLTTIPYDELVPKIEQVGKTASSHSPA